MALPRSLLLLLLTAGVRAAYTRSVPAAPTILPVFVPSTMQTPPSSTSRSIPSKQTAMRNLYEHLFHDYQRELRPVLHENITLPVKLKFWLKQILKVDERDQILNVYCWLELYWTDETLKWDPAEFGGLTRVHVPATKIWKPDILVYNNANMNVAENEIETNAIIQNTGEVMLFRSMITDITCTLSLEQFPFDQQVCYLIFASWSMDGSKIELSATPNTDNLELYIRNTEWTLTDFKVKNYIKVYDCCPHPFPDITYFMVLRRSPSYYIFSLVIPSAFITVVTIVGFFTPHSTTGDNTEKVSLGVTALLSMAIIMMMVSDEVPATSEVIPLIGKYYIGLIFLIFIAAFTTTLTLSYQMRGNAGKRVHPAVRDFFFRRIAGNPYISWAFSYQMPHSWRRRMKRRNGTAMDREQTFLFGRNDGSFASSAGGINGYCKATKLCKEDSHLEDSPQQAQIVTMEDLTGNMKTYLKVDVEDQPDIQQAMNRVHVSLDEIRGILHHDREQRRIQFEWQQVTRIIDRLIMFAYIIVTVVFAVYMLATREPEIKLTDDIMDSVKK
ncbi:acr-18 [Pristionchus pacificus]|uniref:Acr-18 n=1 Tax=Pristionchus pacificus TaxID=54126 RepID=A0A2A6BZ82_PRIPA|nr:acr-18 [Pristionchus pacificus]|eukprot:PDM71254.1 acr-18 [Pristionchus pacificus]